MAIAAADLQAYKGASRSGLPNVHELTESEARILYALEVASRAEMGELQAGSVASLLENVDDIPFSGSLSIYTIGKLHKKKLVTRSRKRNKNLYRINEAGRKELAGYAGNVLHIQPDTGFSGRRQFEDILGNLTGDIKVCDPYVDPKTLDLISSLRSASGVRILTCNVSKESKLRSEARMLASELGVSVEIRRTNPGKLHDRYIVSDSGVLLVGTSLNSIGKKQTFVVDTGKLILDSVTKYFEDLWVSAIHI